MNRLNDIIALDNAYIDGKLAKLRAYADSAARYSAAFEEQYKRRMERRAADSRQFLTIILPAIKEEASLLKYEREIGRHSEAVSEHAVA